MATQTKQKVSFPIAYIVLAALVVFALVLGIIRLVQGLGPSTNLSDFYPWGLWIAFDVFAVPFSAGAFTLAAITHIFNREKYHGIARFAVLAGFLGYLLVVLVLLMDLNRWDQFYSVLLPNRWNLHSFMFEVSMSITIYFGVLVLELVSSIFEDRDWPVIRLLNQWIPLIAGVGVLLSTVHQGSLGALFLLLSNRLSPIWWSPILPLHFLTSAIFSGLSVAILYGIIAWHALGEKAPAKLLGGLAKIAAWVMAIYLVLKLGDLIVAGDLGTAFSSGGLTLMFLVEIIVGVIVPMVLFFSKQRETTRGLLAGTICVLIGLLFNRAAVAFFGIAQPVAGMTYVPHWMEIGILVGALAFGVLGFSLALRFVPTLQKTPKEHH